MKDRSAVRRLRDGHPDVAVRKVRSLRRSACVTCETAAVDVPEALFADADGVSIAWQQFGSGPDVLAVPPLVTNLEILWEHEFYRRFFEYIARHVRVTVFDKRGIGLSDKFHDAPTLEQRTPAILAVMDAAGLDRPALVGASEGGLIRNCSLRSIPNVSTA